MNFMAFAKLVVDVSVEHDGDDWNTPRTNDYKKQNTFIRSRYLRRKWRRGR